MCRHLNVEQPSSAALAGRLGGLECPIRYEAFEVQKAEKPSQLLVGWTRENNCISPISKETVRIDDIEGRKSNSKQLNATSLTRTHVTYTPTTGLRSGLSTFRSLLPSLCCSSSGRSWSPTSPSSLTSPIIFGFKAKAPCGMKQAAMIMALQTENWILSAICQDGCLGKKRWDLPGNASQCRDNVLMHSKVGVNNFPEQHRENGIYDNIGRV